MADKPFTESLDDLERLVQTERLIQESNYTETPYDIQKDVKVLIGNAIVHMIQTIGYQNSKYSTQCLQRLVTVRTMIHYSRNSYVIQGLDLLIQKVLSALKVMGNAFKGRV